MLGLLGEGGSLAIGCIQLGVFGTYLSCSIILYKRGQAFDGTVFMVFAAFFGGAGSMLNIGQAIAEFHGVPFSTSAPGMCWLLCGIFCLAILPSCKKLPKAGFLFYLLGGIALSLLGLLVLGVLSAPWFTPVIAWLLFGVGVTGIFITINTMNSFEGVINFPPLGKPFFK